MQRRAQPAQHAGGRGSRRGAAPCARGPRRGRGAAGRSSRPSRNRRRSSSAVRFARRPVSRPRARGRRSRVRRRRRDRARRAAAPRREPARPPRRGVLGCPSGAASGPATLAKSLSGAHHPLAIIPPRQRNVPESSGTAAGNSRFNGERQPHRSRSGHLTRQRSGPTGPFSCAETGPTLLAPSRLARLVTGSTQARDLRNQETQNHASQLPTREDPQHRDHGSHRRRQDDDDRAHPLLHRPHPQDGRGPRGRRRHGLDGAGAGARHHDHLGRDRLRVEGPPHQHHRHARPRRLHGRGRALAARPRRRDRRSSTPSPASSPSRRPSGARPTSTGSRASPTSTRWTASAPTSQTRSRRCATASAPTRCRSSSRSAPRTELQGRRRPDREQGPGLEGRARHRVRVRGDPRRASTTRPTRPHPPDRGLRRLRRRADGGVPRRAGDPARADRQVAAPRDARHQGDPGPLRLRASRTRACSRCSTRSSSCCPRRSRSRR